MEWEIALDHGRGDWLMLGTSDGLSALAALESWIEEGDALAAGNYGVRTPGQAAWQPFRVDADGAHAKTLD